MTTRLVARAALKLTGEFRRALAIGGADFVFAEDLLQVFPSVATDGQVYQFWSTAISLEAGEETEFALVGDPVNPFGEAIGFVTVGLLAVTAAGANASDLVVGGASSGAFEAPFGAPDHAIAIKPGGATILIAPGGSYDVAAGVGDRLRIANPGDAAIVCRVAAIGLTLAEAIYLTDPDTGELLTDPDTNQIVIEAQEG